MTKLNSYQQAEQLAMLAREHKLDADCDHMWGYRIGKKRYYDRISFSCALLSAFEKVGLHVPEELSERPIDLDR